MGRALGKRGRPHAQPLRAKAEISVGRPHTLPRSKKMILQPEWPGAPNGNFSDSRSLPRNLRGNHLLSTFKENPGLERHSGIQGAQLATRLWSSSGGRASGSDTSPSGLRYLTHFPGCKFPGPKDYLKRTFNQKSGFLLAEVLKKLWLLWYGTLQL